MKLLFCHDHVFSNFEGNYYSPGKLDYTKTSNYLNYFSSVTVYGRSKNIIRLDKSLHLASGNNVVVKSLANLASFSGILSRKQSSAVLKLEIETHDAVIIRLPSEIGLLALKIAKKNDKPILIEIVASAFDCLWNRGDLFAKFYSFILESRMKIACRSADSVIYVTNAYLQSKYPTMGASYSISDVYIETILQAKIKKENNKSFKIGMIGNPSLKIKGADIAIKAVKLLALKGIDVELHVLGGNIISRSSDGGRNIFFHGTLVEKSEVDNWLQELDLYIQPSLSEGLPRSLIEAMAQGLPCIGSNVGGIPELILPGNLFPVGNSMALAHKIHHIIINEIWYKESANYSNIEANKYQKNNLCNLRANVYQGLAGFKKEIK